MNEKIRRLAMTIIEATQTDSGDRAVTITTQQTAALASILIDANSAMREWEESIPNPDDFREREDVAGRRREIELVRMLLPNQA